MDKEEGFLIADDTVLDHWYGMKIGLARWQSSDTLHQINDDQWTFIAGLKANRVVNTAPRED